MTVCSGWRWWRLDWPRGCCIDASPPVDAHLAPVQTGFERRTFGEILGGHAAALWAAIAEHESSATAHADLGPVALDGCETGEPLAAHALFERRAQGTTAFLLLLLPYGPWNDSADTDRLGTFMAASTEGIAFHVDGVITDVNPSLLRMLGYRASQMIGHRTIEFVPPAEHARVRAAIASGRDVAYESFALRADGETIPVEYRAATVAWRGRLQRVILVRDLTEQRKAEERTRHQALHDALTGLPNRAHLDPRLSELTRADAGSQKPFALVFFDLDQLKRINDSLGHGMGDRLLVTIAERLVLFCEYEEAAMGRCWIVRMGGDEFVILVEVTDTARLVAFCNRLQDTLHAPASLPGHGSVQVTASIGVALYPEHGASASTLLRHADLAMYAAKEAGRARTRLFDRSLAFAAERAIEMEREVSVAIRNHEFELHYQPIFRLHDGRPRGA